MAPYAFYDISITYKKEKKKGSAGNLLFFALSLSTATSFVPCFIWFLRYWSKKEKREERREIILADTKN
jgi:hypothetical protein